MHYYRMSAAEALEQLKSRPEGLTNKEALDRLLRQGPNQLERVKHESALTTLARQFKDPMVTILLVSAAFSVYLTDYRTAIILALIGLMNVFIGFFQEHKTESLLKSLEQLVVPQAKVLRHGELQAVDSTELVTGDVVYIEEGDSVPADLRLIEEAELGTNDFALTGESNPSRKFVHAIGDTVPLRNRHNLAFMGTTVATGTGYGLVIGTGMQTELGRIASLSQATRAQASPLQKELNHLAIRIAQGTLVLASLLTLVALKANLGLHSAILLGIGIGAAMIPSGLLAEVNITLAQAAGRLAKSKALVKRLSAVETLGSTNLILTDKTGTLTKNEMTVQKLLIGRVPYRVTGSGYAPKGQVASQHGKILSAHQLKDLELFFMTAALASNAHVDAPDAEHPDWYVIGDPTEGALVTLVRKAGLDPDKLNELLPEVKEFQFDSARKVLSSVRRRDKQLVVFVKGAPESILERSTDLWDHGHVRKLNRDDRAFFSKQNDAFAHQSLRNLALAFRVLPAGTDPHSLKMEAVEQHLTFLGMASMQDPLRKAVPKAVRTAQKAHVKVSIISGDYPTTALAVAEEAGLGPSITVIPDDELPHLADSQILQLVERGGAVFSRVSPEDKLRIVEIARRSGYVVAVTGDGINDAPALKRADIGVAMGRTGTDVAKDAADIVLLDDSFGTLVEAVEQGRLTFMNIKKATRCALTDNASELITVIFGIAGLSLLHIAPAFTSMQILAIDIVAQILPITALGWDRAQANLMHDKPRDLHEHIINRRAVSGFFGFGLLGATLSYGNYLLFFVRHGLSARYLDTNLPLYHQATTLTYVTLVLCLYVYLLFERSDSHEKFFTSYLWSNKRLLGAFAISFLLIGSMIYSPLLQPYFRTAALDVVDLLTALACAGLYLSFRLIQRHTRKHSRHAVMKLHHEMGHAS